MIHGIESGEGVVLGREWVGVEQFLRGGGVDELRRPLWKVLAAVAALQRSKDLGRRERRLIEAIDSSLDRILEVVRDLVDGHAVDEGRPLVLFPRITEVRSLAQRVAAGARADHPDRTIWSAFGISGSAEWDSDRIEQMLDHVTGLAVARSDVGSPVLLTGRDVGEDWLEFEAEFHDVVRAGLAGESLRLAVARHVARSHGGSLELRPGGNGATRIVVRLPRAGRYCAVSACRPK